jgi:2,3-bisphosphoglycerate-dependent phosphoglycerate mutase
VTGTTKTFLLVGKTQTLLAKGIDEAHATGLLLKKQSKIYSYLFTSLLDRAINTANIILEELDLNGINVVRDEALNERDYGELTGLNKDDAREKMGRRSGSHMEKIV